MWSKISVIDFSPSREDLRNHFTAMFYEMNKHGRELHQKWENCKLELTSEMLKEQHLFNSFLDHFSADVTKQEPSSKVHLGRHASIRDELIEYQMERLAKHLAEYSTSKAYRKNVHKDFQQILELRTEAQPFALRGQTFIRAESLLGNIQPFLSLSAAQSIECFKGCYEQAVTASNDIERVGNPLSKDVIAEITNDVTFLYLRKRLNGLPAKFRSIFELLVVICIADSEDMVCSIVFSRVLSESVIRNISKQLNMRQESKENDRDVDFFHGYVKKTAAQIVSHSISVALIRVTTPQTRNISADGLSSSHELDPVLDTDLLNAFELIKTAFTDQNSSDIIQKKFSRDLKDDMVRHAAMWKNYLLLHANYQAQISSSAQIHLKPQCPPWIENHLNSLEKLMVHICLFEFVPRDALDQITLEYLGDTVVKRLRVYDETEQKLNLIARNTTFSTPLLVITDPSTHVAVPYENIVQYAGAGAVRDEVRVDVSMGDTLGELRLASQLKNIEHLAMSGEWIVVRDMQLATKKTGAALRHQVQCIQHLQSSKNYDFRLWLLYEHSGLNNVSAAANLLALLRTERFFFEYPSTLTEFCNFFRNKYEQTGSRFIRAHGQPEAASFRRPRRLGSFAESSNLASVHLENVHSWIQNALLVFHSLFCRHLQSVRAQNENQNQNLPAQGMPTDMMISHFELERASRLLQVHMEQRIMATKLSSSSSSVINVGAAIASEWQTLVNLASLVYMNRQWSPLHSSQCRELLTWCFQTQISANDQSSVMAGNKDVLAKRRSQARRLRDEMNTSATPMDNQADIESHFMPPSRQYQLDTFKKWHIVRSLQIAYGAHNEESSYSAAQQALKMLAKQLPSASSLSKHVHMQRKERRASIIESWKKTKGGGFCGPVGPKQDKHSSWKHALLTHLMQAEIPALESYITQIWSSIEMVLALNAESLESIRANQGATASPFHREVGDILQSISKQDVPKAWATCKSVAKQQHRQNCQGYLFSRRLMHWVTWLRQTIGFYQGLHSSEILIPRLPDVIYMPALHHPEGTNCLQSAQFVVRFVSVPHVWSSISLYVYLQRS